MIVSTNQRGNLDLSRRLWSLWDIMMNFYLLNYDLTVRKLFRLEKEMAEKSKIVAAPPSGGIGYLDDLLAPVPSNPTEEDLKEIKALLADIRQVANEIELDSTLKRLWRPEMKLDFSPSYADLHVQLTTLKEMMQDDLQNKWFYYYDTEKFKLLRSIKEQWGAAYEKFKEMQNDIYLAIDCYATAHYTACVFHLMRVMEFGVQRFAHRLGGAITRRSPQKLHDLSWHQILDELNPRISGMKIDTPARKARQERYRAVQSHLYAVKDAWRNSTMHPRRKGYSPQEALDIIQHVREFMIGLAEGGK